MAPRVYFLVLVLLCFVLAKFFVHIAIYWVFTTCQALIQPLELGTIIEKWKTETEDRSKVLTQGHVRAESVPGLKQPDRTSIFLTLTLHCLCGSSTYKAEVLLLKSRNGNACLVSPPGSSPVSLNSEALKTQILRCSY